MSPSAQKHSPAEEDPNRVLIRAQDEVDDSRTTLGYAVAELKKDIQAQFDKLSDEKKAELPETKLGIFVGAFPLRTHFYQPPHRRQFLCKSLITVGPTWRTQCTTS